MRQFLSTLLFLLLIGRNDRLAAQARSPDSNGPPPDSSDTPHWLLRIYDDNDLINIWGQITDDAYTNGTRFDLFYTREKMGRNWTDRIFPSAGNGSIDLYGWGIMQVMYTPSNLADPYYQPNDYPWSAGLFATHTLYSYNPVRHYDFQTEWVLGVMGPAALGKQVQDVIHQLTNSQQPMGWGHQYSNALLLNLNFTAEKQLASDGHFLELIAGGRASVGTMTNALAVYPLLRIGRMSPYFQGYMSQYASTEPGTHSRHVHRAQFYFLLRPEADLVLTNALLEGGIYTTNPNEPKGSPKGQSPPSGGSSNPPSDIPYPALNPVVWSLNYGAVLTFSHFGISCTQSVQNAMMKGLYCHNVGNISVYFNWL
jgi:lipid A 3-O-deacylase